MLEDLLEQHAKNHNYDFNRKDKIRKAVIKGLQRNKEKFGNYFCPCRVEKIKENVCPCAYHEKEINEKGECHCQLFCKKKKCRI